MAMNNKNPAEGTTEPVAKLARYLTWVETTSGVKRLVTGLIVLSAVLFLLDFVWHRHIKVPGEELYGFHAIVGFAAFTVIVVGAKTLRRLIRRDESFYAPHSVDAEEYPEDGTERTQHGNQRQDSVSTLLSDMLGRETKS